MTRGSREDEKLASLTAEIHEKIKSPQQQKIVLAANHGPVHAMQWTTEDHIGSQSWPSACNAVKYMMCSTSCAHQSLQ